ncbi:lipocalin family protein [Pseudobacteriovorax antillogorgiicola]|uniref:Apolipoprotein D and lipocalin family protein n=1 Tax=Pseudobacteriovorax antillogorgiicola TaxID=1513793 RepID=A0A1Y6BMX1_9BACT|nr:lipocalin family protein [Pseudobacteriovorax antillogorgiicola]TCS54499.1 apolipoprotein D and lipocalin family protein [Pseudobacteriovorax antillogorgiicola]SMF19038.1 apolipoprotein D and lipocalin family protein [Pseudobacteriovorax antillogorgiicola]
MNFIKSVVLASCLSSFSAVAHAEDPIPVQGLELDRYVGEWYEIARIPNSNDTQGLCRNTKAIYEPLEDGTVGVENVCDVNIFGLKLKQRIFGVAAPLSSEEAVFDLTLRPLSAYLPFGDKYYRGFAVEGDYWVLEVGENYEYALVGNPARTNLFVIARGPELDLDVYNDLLSLAAMKHGYGDRVNDLVLTPQD